MSGLSAPPTSNQPWLHALMQMRAETIVSEWTNQFRTLDLDRQGDTVPGGSARSGSGGSGGKGSGSSKKGAVNSFLNKLWVLDDAKTKKKFYIGRGPKILEMTDFYATITKLGITAVLNFARLHEGPLGPGGAADFTDALYFPCTPGEISHFVVPIGDTTAEVIVTNARVTMINDVVAVSDLDIDVNVDIKNAVVGECHTIEPRQNSQIFHIQHFNWPPDEQPWCTDSILQTLSTMHRWTGPEVDKTVNVLVLCADGVSRSAAFVALNHCVVRATMASQNQAFNLTDTVKEAVSTLRAQCQDAMRNERIFTWLNYAIVEHAVKRLVEAAHEKKESKRACDWLAKLRKAVYATEKKSLMNISLMG